MNVQIRDVATTAELMSAVSDSEIDEIRVNADLFGVPALRLSPGKAITGSGADPHSPPLISFESGTHGLQLSRDNQIRNLRLTADPDKCALHNDTMVEHWGRLTLENLSVVGSVRLLARDNIRGGHVEAHGVDIAEADARGYEDRPKGYGVEVISGAFTLWNQQSDPAVTVTADLTGLSAGRPGAPVRGGGIFVSGAGDTGGRLSVSRLETGAVYSDGGIPPGTPDRITGGVFTVHGAFVDTVRCLGPVTTYGPNDMALDNWGTVDRWIADDKITTYGPSGIGFVNFGVLKLLQVNAPIETFGQGARGFNVYDGTVQRSEFDRLVTHADGAVGIQISQPVGEIVVRRGIETFGDVGDSLVKGVVVQLAAIPLSVKIGGSAHRIEVDGGVIAHGAGVSPLEIHGAIETLKIAGQVTAKGVSG